MKTKTIIPFVTLVLGVFWVIYGLANYGFWHPVRGPITGFVPILIAIPLVPVSFIGLLQSLKEEAAPDSLENWTIVLGAALTVFLIFIIGMLAALMIFVFVWTKIYEKTTWRQTIICLVVIFGIIYGAFMTWLQVPLPMGLIMEAIIG